MIHSWDSEQHNINIETSLTVCIKSFKRDDIYKSCIIIIWLTDRLPHNFLTCPKGHEIKDLAVCIVVNEEKKSHCDLDLDQTMLNVELVTAFFIYHNVFKFQVDWTIIFEISCTQTRRQTHRQTDTHQHTQTDMSTLRLWLINHNYKHHYDWAILYNVWEV